MSAASLKLAAALAALALLAVAPSPALGASCPAAVTADNSDFGVSLVGQWWFTREGPNYRGEHYLIADPDDAQESIIRYHVQLPLATGDYEVFLVIPNAPEAATNARVFVKDLAGDWVSVVDQSVAYPDNLFSLGHFRFGAAAYVEISNFKANGFVIADAVVIKPVCSPTTTAASKKTTTRAPTTAAPTTAAPTTTAASSKGYNLVSLFGFDEKAGASKAHDSASSRTARYVNGPTLGGTGVRRSSVAVARTDRSFVRVPHSRHLKLADGQVEFWFRAQGLSGFQALLGKEDDAEFFIAYLSDAYVSVLIGDATAEAHLRLKTKIKTDQWYKLTISFGAAGLRVHLNDVLAARNKAWTTGIDGNTGDLALGAFLWNDVSNTYFTGDFDELSIRSRYAVTTPAPTTRPATTKPATTKPATTKPATTKPATTKPATTAKPATTKPATTATTTRAKATTTTPRPTATTTKARATTTKAATCPPTPRCKCPAGSTAVIWAGTDGCDRCSCRKTDSTTSKLKTTTPATPTATTTKKPTTVPATATTTAARATTTHSPRKAYQVVGQVVSSTDASAISGGLVYVAGENVATTDSQGAFTFDVLPPSDKAYEVEVRVSFPSERYYLATVSFVVDRYSKPIVELTIAASPLLHPGQWRVVTSWIGWELDLDAHVVVEKKCDAWFGYSTCYTDSATAEFERAGRGFETIRLEGDGSFKHYVYRYTADTDFGRAQPFVAVYSGTAQGLIAGTSAAKAISGSNPYHRFWRTVSIDSKAVSVLVNNRIKCYPPTAKLPAGPEAEEGDRFCDTVPTTTTPAPTRTTTTARHNPTATTTRPRTERSTESPATTESATTESPVTEESYHTGEFVFF